MHSILSHPSHLGRTVLGTVLFSVVAVFGALGVSREEAVFGSSHTHRFGGDARLQH
jgi:hypothetical protein